MMYNKGIALKGNKQMKTTPERLSVIETKIEEMYRRLSCIDEKLDRAISNKADQTDVDIINNRIWWFAGLFITGFIGMIVYLIQQR